MAFNHRKKPNNKIGCPCGCNPGEPCLAKRPIIGAGSCPCATLGVDQLQKPQAVTWHRNGHPTYNDGEA